MPETLDTLGAKFDALVDRFEKRFNEVDKRFDGVDKRFDGVDKRFNGVDKRFDEVKSELGVKIEAVEALARLAVERLDDVLKKDVGNSAVHARLEMRIENHDLRILALEGRQPPDAG